MLRWLAGHFAPAVYACDVEINIEVVLHARARAQRVLGSCLWGAGLEEVGRDEAGDCWMYYTPFILMLLK